MVLQRAPRRAVLWGYADTIGDTVTVIKNGVLMGQTLVYRNTTGIVSLHVQCAMLHDKSKLSTETYVVDSQKNLHKRTFVRKRYVTLTATCHLEEN